MPDSEINKLVRDVEGSDESLLEICRAVWQLRWLVAMILLAGGLMGLWHESGQARFRTTLTLRWLSPNISYLYRGYWDVAGKIRAGQLRSLMAAHREASNLALREDGNPWLVRMEVLHHDIGQGRDIGRELLHALRQMDQTPGKDGVAVDDLDGPLVKLRQALVDMECLLAAYCGEMATVREGAIEDPITSADQYVTDGAGPRIPLNSLPLYPWYRSVHTRVAGVLASREFPRTEVDLERRLTDLLLEATERLLECWYSFDLLVAAHDLPTWHVDLIAEIPITGTQRKIQAALLGIWVAGLSSVLFAIPLRWLWMRWDDIVPCRSQRLS